MSVIHISDKRKQEILLDKAGTISFTPYQNNQVAVASSATIEVRKPGGETIVAAGTSATVSAAGVISYSLSAGNSDELGENYKAIFAYVISGVTYYATLLYDVVRNKLDITVTDQDLLNEQADIMTRNEAFSGTVDSSSNTTLVDADLKNYADDYWNGGTVEATKTSDGTKQIRNVTDFVSSTGTLTVGVAWGTNPDTGYRFVVRRGFLRKIELAFDEILYELRGRGNRPALILESSELHLPHVKKALYLICRDYMKEPGDKWDELSKRYDQEYNDAMQKLRLQYDMDEDGVISGNEVNKDITQTRMRR